MTPQVFSYETKIREHHLDTFGHVNNAQYLALFEEARWEMITSRGYGIDVVQKLQKGPVILEVNVKFRRELHVRETIRIESQMLELGGKIGRISQKLLNQAGELSAEATFVVGFLDMQARRLITPTPEWLHAIGWKA